MGIFDGVLLCTDLDGTLFRSDKTISRETKDAIEFFKAEGGYFTFITGRMPSFVSKAYDLAQPNAPIGCINGGGLYDYPRQEYIWTGAMTGDVTDLIAHVDENMEDVGIQVNTFQHVYFARENTTMYNFRKSTGLPNLVKHYRDVDEPIAKILFGAPTNEQILRIQELLTTHPRAQEFDYIRSEPTLFEIMPKGINKGVAVTNLVKHLGLDSRKTIAVGDYNNDVAMFRAAHVGIAVANACPEALEKADYVTVSNNEDAIAHVIRDLQNGKYLSL